LCCSLIHLRLRATRSWSEASQNFRRGGGETLLRPGKNLGRIGLGRMSALRILRLPGLTAALYILGVTTALRILRLL
jgi:hypothetical protein